MGYLLRIPTAESLDAVATKENLHLPQPLNTDIKTERERVCSTARALVVNNNTQGRRERVEEYVRHGKNDDLHISAMTKKNENGTESHDWE
jgi:hypothetical protein